MNNWVQKFDMLCESQARIGLLGSFYFVGMVIGLTFVPKISDIIGRRKPLMMTMLLSGLAQTGFICCTSIDLAFFFMLLLGITFAGKYVVGLSYMLEFTLVQ